MVQELEVIKEDGVLRIVFNRPDKKNALTGPMYDAIVAAMTDAETDADVRCLLFEGAGGNFTSGNDIADFMSNPPTNVEHAPVFKFLLALVHFPKPMLAAVDGVAVGVGSTMLLHCDATYCSDRARFHFPFVDLGLVPEAASSVLLASRVGETKAHEWLMFAEPISPADAEKHGLVTKMVPAAELTEFARDRAKTLAKKPPNALKIAKDLIRGPEKERVLKAMHREGAHFIERLGSEEARTAFMAFFARKK